MDTQRLTHSPFEQKSILKSWRIGLVQVNTSYLSIWNALRHCLNKIPNLLMNEILEQIRRLVYLFLTVLSEEGGDKLGGWADEPHKGGKPHHVAVDKTYQVGDWPSSRRRERSIPLRSTHSCYQFNVDSCECVPSQICHSNQYSSKAARQTLGWKA